MRVLIKKLQLYVAIAAIISVAFVAHITPKASAACAANTANLGSVSGSFTITTAGTYRVWSRIQPDSTTAANNSYTLEVDSGTVAAGSATCNINVGDATIPVNTWTWVDYRDGNSTSKINMTLSVGTHTYTMYGREAGVKLDRVIFSADSTCTPTGNGDTCANSTFPVTPPSDTTPPVITHVFSNITAVIPTSRVVTTVGSVTFRPTATDANGIKTFTNTVNGSAVTLTGGQYITPAVNNDYVFASTAVDNGGANLSSSLTSTIKLRYPDIDRNTKVNTYDVLTVLRQFNSTSQKGYDFNADGIIGTFDVLFVLRSWAP